MQTDEKTCPRCAEVIKSAAQVCRHCNYDFSATGAASAAAAVPVPPPVKKRSPVMIGCLGLLGGAVLLAVIGSMAGGGSDSGGSAAGTGTPAAGAAATPPIVVTASALAAAYAANEAAAQEKYGSSPLEVTGTLESVELGIGDEPGLILRGNEMFTRPQMDLTEASEAKASSLKKGQKVTAICASVSEVIGTPMLKDCELK